MQRPTSVTVFGILNIVFAALGIVGVLGSVMLLMVAGDSKSPIVQLIHENGAYAAWMKISVGIGLLAAIYLIAAGIGLLLLQRWARIASIIYAIYAILMVFVGGAINYVFLVQPLMQRAQEKSGPEAAAALGGAVGGMVGSCFGLIYPILLLIFMFRANVIQAFNPSTPQNDLPQ